MTRPDFPTVSPQTATSVDGGQTLFPALPYDMHGRTAAFLRDDTLQSFVRTATERKDKARRVLLPATFGDRLDALRDLAAATKHHVIENLDWYLERFVKNATAAGVEVHFAVTADAANDICKDIARRAGAKLCVKAKSMVTEETHLVPELQKLGIETVETDLGEFILQLDRDAPSHIVMPMIHKDRVATAKAFEREIDAPYTENPEELTKIARRWLREKYRRADFGVSGANFLVASSGSVVLCTNEGNGRFCTTVPRVHVVFAGIEKLVPTLDHAAVLLKLLARSSTAQPLTVYTQFLTGPRRAHEHDGPEKMHVILIDHGRTGILARPEYRDALDCIRCGACLNACPVYRKATGHAYGSVYSGPIGAVITPLLRGLENYPDLPQASSLCGACFDACPVKIDLPRMLVDLRRDLVRKKAGAGKSARPYRWGARAMGSKLGYRIASWLMRRALRGRAAKDGFITRGTGLLAAWTNERDLPAPAAQSFRSWWKERR